MAQHDYNIANQTFPATRTDINNVLSAVATTNSGSSAPSTNFANQLFYDTSDDKLKMRDSANSQHIDLFTFNQTSKTVTAVAGAEDPTAIAIALG
jgi:hypothetical protein|tara:strand:- start:5010 stop:5294 length:285 start_codon:yes stop_codon:yes gene_type:complete